MSAERSKRVPAALRRGLLALPLVGPAARRLSGAVTHAPARSPLGRLARARAALRPPATGRQVLAILAVLEEMKVRHWVAGGWGVDALAGRQTRDHDDVDIVLDDFDRTVEAVAAALGARGFREVERDRRPTWMPDRRHLEDRAGCQVELVSLDLALVQRACSAAAPPGRPELVAFGTGRIGGQPVPCLSADAQLVVHGGYASRPADRHDLELLQELRSSIA